MKQGIVRMVDIPAHVARHYLGNLGKIDNGVVSVSSLWADEQVKYPLEIEPYTLESYFAQGKNDPAFRTKRHRLPCSLSNSPLSRRGQWIHISRAFRDGSTQEWWALEV